MYSKRTRIGSYKIIVTGIVQGVGFRPFVYRIAVRSGVKGYVKNLGGSEVEIRVEGDQGQIGNFMGLLFEGMPEPARIEKIIINEEQFVGFEGFSIVPSGKSKKEPSQIPPDFAVCDECLREVLDKGNRRYRYPFNSCAYCGPRFSMLYDVPYDRENTAMRDFPLCELCQKEYHDPNNERRFDAQGISCPACGPRLFLETVDGERVEAEDPIGLAAKLLSEGYILAVKGVGGFHIAADPFSDDVVLKLRERKNRPQQPFAVMGLSVDVIKRHAYVSRLEEEILTSPERPIVLLRKREENYELSKYVSPGLDREGFFLYYTPLHYLLLDSFPNHLLIMTSGNKHGFPMCTDEECVRRKLKGVVDYVLTHNRKIVNRVDDSVVKVSNNRVLLLRRSRGYAPLWIKLGRKLNNHVVAVGAELQNVGGVGFDDKAVLTQYIGDTVELEALQDLDKYIEFFVRVYSMKPKIVVADKNPAYQSTYLARKMAERYNAELLQVQHHFAHVLSVAAENGYEEGVGIAIDGVGYGDDGNAWGGEVIRFKGEKYERVYHLKYVPYVGGDVNALRPRRMLALFLSTFMGWDEVKGFVKLSEAEYAFLERGTKRGGIMTSSTGRVLDAVSAFLGVCDLRTYEGEPAIKLEAYARGGRLLDLEIPVEGEEINTIKIFEWLVDNRGKYRGNDVAYTVQYRLGEALVKAALKANPTDRILVSGGAAVNEYILKGMMDNSEGLEIVTPKRVPAGDGGIALGQIYYATYF